MKTVLVSLVVLAAVGCDEEVASHPAQPVLKPATVEVVPAAPPRLIPESPPDSGPPAAEDFRAQREAIDEAARLTRSGPPIRIIQVIKGTPGPEDGGAHIPGGSHASPPRDAAHPR